MANQNDRHAENVPGRWYVDAICIICGMCGEYAPETFRASADGTQNIVFRQPVTPQELEAAKEAMEGCPVDSIGNDGIWKFEEPVKCVNEVGYAGMDGRMLEHR